MSEFMIQLLDLVFFLFDKQDNPIVFIPFVVLFWCVSWSIVKILMRLFLWRS